MLKQNRLIRVEAALTPKQAVLLWLRQEIQGRTSSEYARWLIQQPPSAAPRSRVEKRVVEAIRVAMKGQERGLIDQAARQGQMHIDFLILLVLRANSVVIDDSRARSLKVLLLFEQLRNAAHADNQEQAIEKWVGDLVDFATELLSVRDASELIRNKYFDGESILLKDAAEDLAQQAKAVQLMIDGHDRVVIEADQRERVIDSGKFRNAIQEQASYRASCVVAQAKSKMLHDFGQGEAADALIRPYVLEGA